MQVIHKEHALIQSPLSNPWIWLSGIILLSALFYAVDANYGWSEVFAAWQSVPLSTIVISYSLFICSHILRSARIYFLLSSNRNKLEFKSHFPIVIKASSIHQFLNNLLPMRMGELALPVLLKRYFDVSWGKGLSKLIWLRVFDALIMGSVAGIVFAAFFYANIYLGLIALTLALGIGALVIVIGKLKGKKLNTVLSTFVEAAPPTRKSGLTLVIMTLLAWLTKLAALVLMVQALGGMQIMAALSAIVSVEFGALLPVNGIAGAGNFEATFSVGASLFQSFSGSVLGVAVNLHFFVFLSTASLALITLPIRQHQLTHSFTSGIEANPCGSK